MLVLTTVLLLYGVWGNVTFAMESSLETKP